MNVRTATRYSPDPVKFPPYGRQLFDARSAGKHPYRVEVVYDENWRQLDAGLSENGRHAMLAITPSEYKRNTYDFRVLAGLPVDVVDRHTEELRIDGEWAIYWLAAEIARWAVEVVVHSCAWADESGIYGSQTIDWCAWGSKNGTQFPSWWPKELDEDYGRRNQAWLDEWHREASAFVSRLRCGVCEVEGA